MMKKLTHKINVYLNDELVIKNLKDTVLKILITFTFLIVMSWLNSYLNNSFGHNVPTFDFALLTASVFSITAIILPNIKPILHIGTSTLIYLLLLPISYIVFNAIYPFIGNHALEAIYGSPANLRHIQDLAFGVTFILCGIAVAIALLLNKKKI